MWGPPPHAPTPHAVRFQLAMADIQIKKTGEEPGAAALVVTVPPEHVREAEERATADYQRRARLPGFRRGKAPAAIVKKQFADDIRQQALQELIRESWSIALEQEKLKPIADPHIHNLKWETGAGAPVTFEFHVEVKPAIKLERLANFRLTRTVPKVTDEMVAAQLNELRGQRAPWLPVTGEKPKPRDLVQVTIATREGAQVKDPQPYQLVLGEGRAIPELEQRIMGLLPGETIDTIVRFPDDFAGEDLEQEAAREADARVRGELIEQIVAANRVVAPRPLVERVLYAYAQAYSIPEERWEQFATEFRPVAEAQVRRDLVLDAVVERHGLRATPEELDGRIRELAGRRGMPAEQLRASLEKAKRLRDVERSLTEEKVFTFLLSQSTVESP